VVSTGCEHTPPDSLPLALVGRLEKIDAASIVMAGGVRVFIRPGLWFPGCRLGTNLAVWAHLTHGAVCADWVEPAVALESGCPELERARRREKADILTAQAGESVVLCRRVVDALEEQTRLTLHVSPVVPWIRSWPMAACLAHDPTEAVGSLPRRPGLRTWRSTLKGGSA